MTNKRHPLRKFGLIAALAMLSALMITACGSSSDSSSGSDGSGALTEVSIGTQPWIGYGPLWIADAKGFDKENGVDIKMVNFSTDQDLETGFASGKFQGASNANNTLIRLADLGIDFRITLMEDFSLDADAIVTCDPDIKTVADIADKKVAYEEFSVSDVLFRFALKQAGVDYNSIDYVPIPASDAGTAVVAGKVDVAVTYEPYLQAAVTEGDNCRILYTAGERPGLISDALAFSTDFANSDPEAVVGVLRSWGEAIDFYKSNPAEAKAIISKAVGEDPAALEPSFKGVKLFGLQESQDFLENDYEQLWNEIRGIMSEQGQIDGSPEAADYLDLEPGKQALKK